MKILSFFTNANNTRLLLLGVVAILSFSLFKQCEKINEITEEKKRIENNLIASNDTIRTFKLDKETWRSEKLGFKLTLKELQNEYNDLLGKFGKIKDAKPITIVNTEYVIRDSLIYVDVVFVNDSTVKFKDSVFYNPANYRIIGGMIPLKSGRGIIDLELGMNLNLGVFENKKGAIEIKVDTNYPNIRFTKIEGAYIMNDKSTTSLRRPFGIGLQLGYGLNFSDNIVRNGVYIGVGASYSPKFLQFGK